MGQKSNSWHYYGWWVQAAVLFIDSRIDLVYRLSQSPMSLAIAEMRSREVEEAFMPVVCSFVCPSQNEKLGI